MKDNKVGLNTLVTSATLAALGCSDTEEPAPTGSSTEAVFVVSSTIFSDDLSSTYFATLESRSTETAFSTNCRHQRQAGGPTK